MTSKIIGFFQSITGKADSVLTTKGDLATYSTTRIREAVGTNNKTILADSAQATGIKWGASATSTLTTAGDLLVASGANALTRLARGSDNYILKMNGTSLNWEAETGGGKYYELLDEDITTGTGSTLTLTMPSNVNEENYSALIIYCSFGASAAFDLNMEVAGISDAALWGNETRLDGDPTAVTYLRLAGVTPVVICGTEVTNAAGNVGGTTEIILRAGDKPMIFSNYAADNTEAFMSRGNHFTATGDIDEIEISTSTSTWTDMCCRCYGVKAS